MPYRSGDLCSTPPAVSCAARRANARVRKQAVALAHTTEPGGMIFAGGASKSGNREMAGSVRPQLRVESLVPIPQGRMGNEIFTNPPVRFYLAAPARSAPGNQDY